MTLAFGFKKSLTADLSTINLLIVIEQKATKYLMFEKSIKHFETNRDRFILE